ncbi:MAG TPA: hypothetical protein VJ914_09400 [Pseudonocardiaceae bacterium]|nr:hypothetical protein [Pseudonocardiaceae bacterium]
MATGDQIWRLVRDEELIGEIVVDGADMPWLQGSFVPAPAFGQIEDLFDREQELLDAEDFPAWETAYEQIASTMTLVAPAGPAAEFLLHIEDGRARFRWSAEPFPEEA